MRGCSSIDAYVCMTDTECHLLSTLYPMKNAYTINAVVTQRTEQNVCWLQNTVNYFVIVVHVSHPAEQCTIDNL